MRSFAAEQKYFELFDNAVGAIILNWVKTRFTILKSNSRYNSSITSHFLPSGKVSVATRFGNLSIVNHRQAGIVFIQLRTFGANHKLIKLVSIKIQELSDEVE